MKAITITQELKDRNKIFQNRETGSIYQGSLPNSFWGAERIVGGYAGRIDLHEADGWFNVVYPAYDSATHKLGDLFFEVNKFTFPVIVKTPEELAGEAAQNKITEAEKIKEVKVKAYVESVLTPAERLLFYPEWVQKAYSLLTEGLPTKVTFKGKVFQNNVEGNINAPDKGGWTEIK